MTDLDRRLADNVQGVRQRINDAAAHGGRRGDEVTLVAVTKYVDATIARRLALLGCLDLGESRPQSLWQKAEALNDLSIRWHMIGHLQRNKARRTLPLINCLHSADSVRLLDMLNEQAALSHQELRVLLEVGISREAAKTGFPPEELLSVAHELERWSHLHICGLMAMSGQFSQSDEIRHQFAQVRRLREQMQSICSSGIELRELSMGMSDDFEIAVEEGATMVRVGSALFEGVPV